MVDHLENIGNIEDTDGVEFDENIGNGEDMNDVVFENIRNMNEEQLDEVFNGMDVDFENILDQDSSDEESILSDDVGFTSDASEYETDIEEKFIPAAEIRALNDRTKYCMIQSYYTTGGPLTVCAACMVLLANIDTVGMHYIKKHSINYIDALNGRSCTNCRVALYTIFPCNKCPQCTN
ncbi:hypothetical protein ALC57_05480 [Trachymyrmex cornetzi]|uniref:Uncharacterized protein n=1 Tax=Trachymyrmex cornetzi TaxID=471704 RepID=A0A151JAQ8_9HYME|nr:hypothetical protein ALC57_05480 [Trachymyrmex cornetzi]